MVRWEPLLVSTPLLMAALVAALAWSRVGPARWSSPWLSLAVGAAAGCAAAALGLVPWTGRWLLTAWTLCIALAFAVAGWLGSRRARELALPPGFVRTQLAIAMAAGIAGARLWDIVQHGLPPGPDGVLGRIIDLDRGDLVWYGGLVTAAPLLIWHARRSGVAVLTWVDATAPAGLIALAIGRVGCFLNGCCYGRPTDLPWGCHFHDAASRHPSQLYEALVAAAIGIVLWSAWSRRRGAGGIVGWALIAYGAWRLAAEVLRGDTATPFSVSPLHITPAQWTSVVLIAGGAALRWWARRRVQESAAS